jgi:hypothetical protein
MNTVDPQHHQTSPSDYPSGSEPDPATPAQQAQWAAPEAGSDNPSSAAPVDPAAAPPATSPTAQGAAGTQPTADANHRRVETSSEPFLFADGEMATLRARWDDVQAGFVDDPRNCVRNADGLVSEVVKQLTNGFTEARSRLENSWGRGEEASTEDLRVALTRYRDFFERLLTV